MLPDDSNRLPVSPFSRPTPGILIDPNADGAFVAVGFNSAWLPVIIGALKVLTLQTTWVIEGGNTLELQQKRAMLLLDAFTRGVAIMGTGLVKVDASVFELAIAGVDYETPAEVDSKISAAFASPPPVGSSAPAPGDFTALTAQSEVVTSVADAVPLTVIAEADQTADVQQWKAIDGTVLASISPVPALTIGNVTTIFPFPDSGFGTQLVSTLIAAYDSDSFPFVGLQIMPYLDTRLHATTNMLFKALDVVGGSIATGVPALSFTARYGVYIRNMGLSGITTTNVYGLFVADQKNGGTNYGIYTGTGINRLGDQLTVQKTDAVTNAVTNVAIIDHESSATPAANYGTGIQLQGKSANAANRAMARVRSQWLTATDASRKASLILSAFDTVERDALSIAASGTAAQIGFLGAAPVVRPTVSGSRGANAALASLLTALANLGLIVDSTTV